jgi:purine-binding chemotaxis protein CheW
MLEALQDYQLQEIVVVDEEKVKMVIFTLSDRTFAFYGSTIREILPPGEITWVPGLPDFLPGLINVRGDIESVLDIRRWLGLDSEKKEGLFIVMAKSGEVRSGILVDEIKDVVDVPINDIKPPLSTLESSIASLIVGEMQYQGNWVVILDVEKLFLKIAAS